MFGGTSVVPPTADIGGGNRELAELIDEAVWLEHHVYVAGAIGIVVSQFRLDKLSVGDPADIERAA